MYLTSSSQFLLNFIRRSRRFQIVGPIVSTAFRHRKSLTVRQKTLSLTPQSFKMLEKYRISFYHFPWKLGVEKVFFLNPYIFLSSFLKGKSLIIVNIYKVFNRDF